MNSEPRMSLVIVYNERGEMAGGAKLIEQSRMRRRRGQRK